MALPALLVLLVLVQTAEADLVGHVTVVDGDTLEIHGRRVRLLGVDAPESSQTCEDRGKPWRCGQQAALALDAEIGGRPVACSDDGVDRYGRTLGTCTAGGENLNGWLVRQGWALAYRRYTETYVDDEQAAKAAHLGIWRGSFVAPWDYRADKRAHASAPGLTRETTRQAAPRATPPTPRTSVACAIKGNINGEGEKIYHTPASPAYAKTRINTRTGERYFCTEAEAQAAGWRAARGTSAKR